MTSDTPKDRRTAEHSQLTADQRRQRARIAAMARWAKTADRAAGTQAARERFLQRFEDQVDPERELPAHERARRAEYARREHMQRLAYQRHRAS